MAISNLFKFKEVNLEDNKLSALVELNSENELFNGHFPNNPVTPGVVQIQIVNELLNHHYRKKLELKTLGRCKFLAVLNPETTSEISITLSIDELSEELRVKASGQNEGTDYFKFSASFV